MLEYLGFVPNERTFVIPLSSDKNKDRICCKPPCCIAMIFFISTFNDDLSKQNGESSNVRSTGIMTALKNGGLSIVRAYGRMTA